MSDGTAYATTNPETVAAFLAATAAIQEFARKVNASARELGKNKGPLRTPATYHDGDRTIGLAADNPDDPPAGWRYSRTQRCLLPRSEKAKRWLAEHQPPADANIRAILVGHGLPINDLIGPGRHSVPTIGHWQDTVWAYYRGMPGDWLEGRDGQTPAEAIWSRRPLSEYHAALEASTAANTPT